MIRLIGKTLIAFDCEWIPDTQSARLLFPDMENADDPTLLKKLWESNGATEENPKPFVRLMQSRVVSIAMMIRSAPDRPGDQPKLQLITLPKDPTKAELRAERDIVGKFLTSIGRRRPQLIGFNSKASDLRILAQRALALGIPARVFLNKPQKPWNECDYFARDNDFSIDLMDAITGGYSKNGAVSLHEACTLCGIPGKFDGHGDEVLDMWQRGDYTKIVQYNCYDAISTYLLWLRVAWVSGLFEADEDYETEQLLLREYLMGLCENPEYGFIENYIAEWDRLSAIYDSAK